MAGMSEAEMVGIYVAMMSFLRGSCVEEWRRRALSTMGLVTLGLCVVVRLVA